MNRKLFKGKNKVPTLCIKLTFQSKSLPPYLLIGYQRFTPKIFIDNVWQCFKCQRFGHNAKECKSKPRCLVCAGNHEFRDCPSAKKNGTYAISKCTNCGGPHAANYGGCPNFKIAKKVETVRATQRISYKEALASVKSQNTNLAQNNQSAVTIPGTSGLHSIQPRKNLLQTKTREAETQTAPACQTEDYANLSQTCKKGSKSST